MLRTALVVLVVACVCSRPSLAQPAVPTLTYQGRLTDTGGPVTAPIDIQFTVHSHPTLSAPTHPTQLVAGVVPDNQGAFTAEVSLAGAFTAGGERYLEVQVSPAGQGVWTTLSPRQRLTHAPFAVRSSTADSAATSSLFNGQTPSFYQNASNLTGGTLPSARLSGVYSALVGFTNTGNAFVGAHSGPGSGLFSLNASNISTGVLGDGRLSGTYSAALNLSSPSNTLVGTHSGSGAGLTGLNADNISSGTLADARLSGNVAMLTGANVFGNFDNAFLGRVSIGTTGTSEPLHVSGGSAGAVTADPNSVAVLERSGNAYLSLLSPAANARGIVFGEPGDATMASILYNPPSEPDGFEFRATGNQTRMVIDASGSVGVSTGSPEGKLHVFAGSAGATTAFPGSIAVFETDLGGYISLLSPASNARGVLFGEPGNQVAGAVVYNTGEVPSGLEFRAASGQICMTINSSENVGIGTAGRSTDARLHVQSDGARALKVDRFTSDGELLGWARDDATIGSVSVAGGVVTYGAFTGVHYAELRSAVAVGDLVSLTGDNTTLGGRDPAETVYGVAACAKANDPAVLGVYVGSLPGDSFDHRTDIAQIAAVGNGDMWVVDTGSDIAPGDYLVSSEVPGCAMRDDPGRFEIGHVVARAAGRVAWGEIKPDDRGVRRARVSVLFGNFVRTDPDLASRVRRLEELLGQR